MKFTTNHGQFCFRFDSFGGKSRLSLGNISSTTGKLANWQTHTHTRPFEPGPMGTFSTAMCNSHLEENKTNLKCKIFNCKLTTTTSTTSTLTSTNTMTMTQMNKNEWMDGWMTFYLMLFV